MRIGFGCVSLGSVSGGRSWGADAGLVREAVERGVTVFDTADAYANGSSERILGDGTKGRRSGLVLATKGGYRFRDRRRPEQEARKLAKAVLQRVRPVSGGGGWWWSGSGPGSYDAQDFSSGYLHAAVDASLGRLRTDHIDVFQLHGPRQVTPELIGQLGDLVAAGKVRRFGIGAESVAAAAAWVGVDGIEVIQLPFGILDPEAADQVIPAATARGIEVWVRGVFGGGLFATADRGLPQSQTEPKRELIAELRGVAQQAGLDIYRLAFGYVAAVPGVSTMLLGMSSSEHLQRNLALADGPPLATDVVAASTRRARPSRRGRRGVVSRRPPDDERVVVVGSGPCGAMAAARLVERGVDVLMLDAGTHPPRGVVVKAAGNTVFRWVSQAEMSADRQGPLSSADVEWYSSLSLGGLSNYWTAAVPRFAPTDFTDGARLDERYAWPVTYAELEPFYEYAERALVVTAGADPIPGVPPNVTRFRRRPPADWGEIIDRANAAGAGVGLMAMAKGRPWMVARRGTEFCSYHCVVEPLSHGRRFELRRGAQVERLVWSSSTGRVESVEYRDAATGERAVVRPRAVVVAAGAIDSTLLLLRSTSSDFPNGLGNAGGLVGRYLHDHPRQWWVADAPHPVTALAHPVYVARPPHETDEPMMASSLTIGLAARPERLKTFYRGKATRFGVQVFGTMVPTPEVGVDLGSAAGADPIDRQPTITLRYDAAARRNMEAARDRLREVFAAAGMDVSIPGPFHELHPGSSVHFGGSVRMHRSREHGVLDGWNRMHDVPNVVVADSSCFTTGPEKNPTLTAMALAARAADHLAEGL